MVKPELSFVATCDLVAMVKGRALPRAALLDGGTGVGWVPADLALTAFGGIADPNPFGALGDLRLIPDLKTEIILPPVQGGEPLSLFLATQANLDGTAWECDPRNALRSAISRFRADSEFTIMASFEHEFTLLPLDGSQLYGSPFGLDSLRAAEPFGTQLLKTLAEIGFEVENWLPEYGAGQFEITLKPADALTAADRAVVLREVVRDVARRNSLRASFAPLLSTASISNGVHIHLSLWKDGEPATYDPGRPGDLSGAAAAAFGGILKHAESLLAWTAPSQISFLRLQPHRWSAGAIYIAKQDREALLRICPIVQFGDSDPARAFNVEYRAADATANPWLAMASLVHAMSEGVATAESGILVGTIDERPRPLPANLDDAIRAFKSDAVAQRWFAPNLVATHLGVREAEAISLLNMTDDEKCEKYSNVY
ncbi:MAG TPA: glutamine synthetase family protein [Candidatus Nanopelagicaceae bacterium]|nr:glutamine synthetase family protein [Candidatus Nanopelagicaceae bacterium]